MYKIKIALFLDISEIYRGATSAYEAPYVGVADIRHLVYANYVKRQVSA